MEVIIKAFCGIFFVICLAVLGVGLVKASVDARNANAFAGECRSKIENSNYAESVVEACREDAAGLGYTLDVRLYRPRGGERIVGGSYTLGYQYQIPILGIGRPCVVCGAIR